MNISFLWFFLLANFSLVQTFFTYNTFFPFYRMIRFKLKESQYKIKKRPDPSKIIVNTPAGLNGFYTLGVTSFIKEHYELHDYLFSGASAGAWNSVFMAYKGNSSDFINKLLESDKLKNATSVLEVEKTIKDTILNVCNEECFDLSRVNVGVAVMPRLWRLRLRLVIFNDFETLEDAIDCCVASSHIPFITGGLFHKYRGKFCFDGGFFNYPYLNTTEPSIIISPSMWNSTLTSSPCPSKSLKEEPLNVTELYMAGYKDSLKNKHILDNIFYGLEYHI